jgi:protein gp37
MGENSGIQWTTHTFNPWIGCQRVSPGCVNCYAEHRNAFVRIQRKQGRELWGPKGERHVTADANWRKPLAWNEAARKAGVRAKVFCASLADVFEDRRDLDAPRARLFALIEQTPHLDWQLLTKRAEAIARLVPPLWMRDGFPDNVWMGVSVEDQKRADERLPYLVRIPAPIRFLSCEPLLEDVDLSAGIGGVHWVIVGGESGNGARVFDVSWAESIIDQCRNVGVACFVKQLGARVEWQDYHHDHALRLRDSHGGDWSEWPEHLRVREFPTPAVPNLDYGTAEWLTMHIQTEAIANTSLYHAHQPESKDS